MVVASADTGIRPLPARAIVMAAAQALLEYVSVGRTDNDRESAPWGSAGQTEAIELGDRGRLHPCMAALLSAILEFVIRFVSNFYN